ncbi:hypothetical protein ONS96_003209 [Cadophora gregata f. sp. sojae]|nr:hypothetical protein ONS96_003209 [Cadophora gregata f. sp. sojae]
MLMLSGSDNVSSGEQLESDEDDILIRSIRSGSVNAGLNAIYTQSQIEFDEDEVTDSQMTQSQVSPVKQSQADNNDDPGSQDSSQGSIPKVSKCKEYSDILAAAHSDSIHALVKAALNLQDMPCDRWVNKRKAGSHYDDLVVYLVVMLLGMDDLILEHFVRGDLAAASLQDPALRRKLDALDKNGTCPCIYAQYLVTRRTGISPTVQIILDALDDIDLYARGVGMSDKDSSMIASRIDSAHLKPASVQHHLGERRYLEGLTQRSVCEEWSRNLRARLETLPPNAVLDRPLAEIGYATKPSDRLKQHARHSSSNYLMNLMEATLMMRYGNQYRIAQFVVFHNVHLTHAMYAEILLTRIALGYISEGGGFSHCQAGISHGGADSVGSDYYERMQKSLYVSPAFNARLKKEIENREAVTRTYEEMVTSAYTAREVNAKSLRLAAAIMTSIGDGELEAIEAESRDQLSLLDRVQSLMDLAGEDIAMSDDE